MPGRTGDTEPAPGSRMRSVNAMVGLPIGTRVLNRRTGLRGTVMHHDPEYSRGRFPVRWDDRIWQICNARDVTVLVGVAATGSRASEVS